MTVGTHGSTYGGNPLGCAVGLKVLEIVGDPDFLDGVSRRAAHLRQGLEGLVASHPAVFGGVRGRGLLTGLECRVPPVEVRAAAEAERLLTVPASDGVLRLLPALNVDEADLTEAVARLDRAAAALTA